MRHLCRKESTTILVALCSAAFITVSCGESGDEAGPVAAMNLATKQRQNFPSPADVPTGWTPCAAADCSDILPPGIDFCESLPLAACEQASKCRIEEVCVGSICAGPEGSPGVPTDKQQDGTDNNRDADSAQGGGSTPGNPASPLPCEPEPPVCQKKCVMAQCHHRSDERSCLAAGDGCEWVEQPCELMGRPCVAGEPCPPQKCDSFVCREKQPPPPPGCDNLGQKKCEKDQRCEWLPGECM